MTLVMETVAFYKMHGCGNDFILIDNRSLNLDISLMGYWSEKLCRRGFGIHGDGVVFLDAPPADTDLSYIWHFFNRDGSQGEMCGNAARCTAWLAHALKIAPPEHTFGTLAGRIRVTVLEKGPCEGDVRVQLPNPENAILDVRIDMDGTTLCVHRVVIGVPHAVVFVKDLNGLDVCGLGSRIRHHAEFAPQGTNVNFAQVTGLDSIRLRTFERGVEDETFACGTGAASTLYLAHRKGYTGTSAVVHTVTGQALTIELNGETIYLQGPARLTFTGQFYPLALGLPWNT
ncbi:MAG: diaminopimelate epimerase [Pseudomonadota bacterium]